MAPRYKFLSGAELRDFGFKQVGDDVLIHELANIVFAENITIGEHVRIDAFTNLIASTPISIGDHVHIGSFCHLTAVAPITLEDFVGISHGCIVLGATDDFSGTALTGPTVAAEFKNVQAAPVTISRHCVIGANSVVMPGVTVHEAAIVGALSLVREDVPAWAIYGGVPAKRIGERSKALLDFERRLGAKSP